MKKMASRWNDLCGRESSRQPVIPPAPLTGDAGRGCGDASRAPLFIYFIDGKGLSAAGGSQAVVRRAHQKSRTRSARSGFWFQPRQAAYAILVTPPFNYATLGVRLRELRWKNSA
jgi:hypothetical protein